jgi:DNA-binding GntR family transcriptional regulator
MAIEKITSVTLRQKVYDQLRTNITAAELLPGEVISLRGLAEEFGVSLLPVREAVWQLESEKILVVESNKRIQVNQLTRKEFEEILNLRLLLESEAVDKACQKRSETSITKVKQAYLAMEKLAGVASLRKNYIQKNDEFHHSIYSCAKSPLLMDLIQRLLARVNPYIYLYAIEGRDLTSALQCHNDMLTGFAEGNSEKTIAALHRDLTDAAGVIIKKLQ